MQELELAIIGSGPAGLTAGIYTSRARIATTLFAGLEIGGQLMYTSDVENFPGFPAGKPGPQLMIDMQSQATRFGTQIKYEQITAVDLSQQPLRLWTSLPEGTNQMVFKQLRGDALVAAQITIRQKEAQYTARALIIATGASSVMLDIPGEQTYFGRGVSVCAVCDAAFYQDKTVFVVGGGDSAMEDALALAKFTKSVTLVHRSDAFRASKIMQERVLAHEHIKVLWNTRVAEVLGNGTTVTGIKTETAGQIEERAADGFFLAIGHRPNSSLFLNQLKLDQAGYITLLPEGHYHTNTSVPGVFAAGDVADHRYRQAVVSAGMGTQAALDVEHWLMSQ